MTSIYPKIPGYSIYHDCTKTDFKKISSTMLEAKRNGELKVSKSNLPIPRQQEVLQVDSRSEKSQSSSQQTFINHFGKDINELFQPDYVKMDKQVNIVIILGFKILWLHEGKYSRNAQRVSSSKIV